MGDDIKEKAEEIADVISEEAKDAVSNVKEEAAEVFQEAKAAIKGETLSTANTVGGAGYREAESPKKGPEIASLVLGIVSLVCALFGWGALVGLVVAIVGTALGAKARKIAQTGVATAGFICSILGIVFNGVAIVCVIACVGAAGVLSTMQ
ncbi:MAG: hypothetical protein K6G78_06995 [bacterium]|nr:hypothetical protein [bacterium]